MIIQELNLSESSIAKKHKEEFDKVLKKYGVTKCYVEADLDESYPSGIIRVNVTGRDVINAIYEVFLADFHSDVEQCLGVYYNPFITQKANYEIGISMGKDNIFKKLDLDEWLNNLETMFLSLCVFNFNKYTLYYCFIQLYEYLQLYATFEYYNLDVVDKSKLNYKNILSLVESSKEKVNLIYALYGIRNNAAHLYKDEPLTDIMDLLGVDDFYSISNMFISKEVTQYLRTIHMYLKLHYSETYTEVNNVS